MKKLLFLLLLFNSQTKACVVLLYHHFSDKTPASTSISVDLFEEHLKYIKDNNFQVLTIKELVNNLENKLKMPDKCVVLTVDDAYTSIYDNAYPLLKQYEMPMSVFVSTDGVDDGYKSLMSYQQMRDSSDLISYYNHSANHMSFAKITKNQVLESIQKAQQRLQEELKTTDKILAYPYGEYNLDAYNLVKDLGYIAFGQQSGAIGLGSNMLVLPRFPMNNNYGNIDSFKTKINTLAMPILSYTIDPIVKDNNPPTLELELQDKLNLNCFAGNKIIKNIKWKGNTAFITADDKLPVGRNKYNCTAKSDKPNRYYWFSQQWIVFPVDIVKTKGQLQ